MSNSNAALAVNNLRLGEDILDFIEKAKAEAALAFQVFRETNTITANGTVGFVERIPGHDLLVSFNYPGPFNPGKNIGVTVSGFDGIVYIGKNPGAVVQGRYTKLFIEHPEVTTISHVHSPALAAWAQTHRSLPIRYVPVQRYKLVREIPVYIDRRQAEVDFILDTLRINKHTPAILEANGGATVWGTKGLRDTAEFILILEEGAKIQRDAEAIGGSRDYGPGVLAQQFKMSGLTEQAIELGLLPPAPLKSA
jgi:L-ribulose-5-phosphate 4-epimerase